MIKLKGILKETVEFIPIEDFLDNIKLYRKGNLEKQQLITSFNRLKSEDQKKVKDILKSIK